MGFGFLFILSLHTIAGAVFLILALRDGLGFLESLYWGGIGFISGIVGLIARARMDRRHVHYMHIVQDSCLNIGLELLAVYGMPHLLT
ncbi:MAG: hypothetical protein ABSF71_02695 [Terriglobia bacterium]|jgi:hypothetical protein